MRTERVVLQFTKGAQGEALALTLREPCGHDELAVPGLDTRSAVELLDRLLEVEPGTALSCRRMTASDRDALLAALHRLCWGDRIETTLRCAACGEPFDMDFRLSDLQRQLCMDRKEPQASWRVPLGEDELSVASLPAPEAVRNLAWRCGVEDEDRNSAAETLEKLAPILDLDLHPVCPECGQSQTARFDVQSFLLQRLMEERELLLDEVHILASSYGWSLSEILGLPRGTRRHLARRITERRPS